MSYIPTEEEYRIVRAMFDPSDKLSDSQISLFLCVAKQRKLDPKLKQICVVPKFNKNTQQTEAVIITQIDGFRLIAERTGKYSPGKPTEFTFNENGGLIFATAFVKKLTSDGSWHEVGETAYFTEYDAGTFPWKKMPTVMLGKCAEARALRRAFPDDLSGLYTEDEMEQSGIQVNSPNKEESKEITKETAELIRGCIGDNHNVETMLLNLCKVKSLENIKESQLEACRKFVKAYKKKKKNEDHNEGTLLIANQ